MLEVQSENFKGVNFKDSSADVTEAQIADSKVTFSDGHSAEEPGPSIAQDDMAVSANTVYLPKVHDFQSESGNSNAKLADIPEAKGETTGGAVAQNSQVICTIPLDTLLPISYRDRVYERIESNEINENDIDHWLDCGYCEHDS